MKDKSLIVKKVPPRLPRRVKLDESDKWKGVNWNLLGPRELCEIMEKLTEKLGIRVKISTYRNFKLEEYLTEEHEDILLGNKDEET